MENNIITIGAAYNTLKHLVSFARAMGYDNPMASICATDDTAFFSASSITDSRVLWNLSQRTYDDLRAFESDCKEAIRISLENERKRLDETIARHQEIIDKLNGFAAHA